MGGLAQYYIGRPVSRPYTSIGIGRVPCARCGKPANQQWQACANGGRYVPMCKDCDIELNEMVLKWLGHPHTDTLMDAYRKRMAEDT